jgi:ABC-type glutathione transport system ATPase component
MAEPVLEVRDLTVSFPSERGRVSAVRGLSYQVRAGEVLGIVGESGSGKSVSSLTVMGLLPPQARVTGSIRFQGRELLGRSDAELSQIRGRRIAMISQDPLSALTPVYTVGKQVAEALLAHGASSRQAGPCPGGGAAQPGRHPGRTAAVPGVPARVLWWHAPARDDRDGHRQRPGFDHC